METSVAVYNEGERVMKERERGKGQGKSKGGGVGVKVQLVGLVGELGGIVPNSTVGSVTAARFSHLVLVLMPLIFYFGGKTWSIYSNLSSHPQITDLKAINCCQ